MKDIRNDILTKGQIRALQSLFDTKKPWWEKKAHVLKNCKNILPGITEDELGQVPALIQKSIHYHKKVFMEKSQRGEIVNEYTPPELSDSYYSPNLEEIKIGDRNVKVKGFYRGCNFKVIGMDKENVILDNIKHSRIKIGKNYLSIHYSKILYRKPKNQTA